ncbi:hypothetical protein [Pseudothermotoga sp.]
MLVAVLMYLLPSRALAIAAHRVMGPMMRGKLSALRLIISRNAMCES